MVAKEWGVKGWNMSKYERENVRRVVKFVWMRCTGYMHVQILCLGRQRHRTHFTTQQRVERALDPLLEM